MDSGDCREGDFIRSGERNVLALEPALHGLRGIERPVVPVPALVVGGRPAHRTVDVEFESVPEVGRETLGEGVGLAEEGGLVEGFDFVGGFFCSRKDGPFSNASI